MLFIIYGTPILTLSQICLGKYISWDLPGGAVDRSLPVNAGDPPLIPGPVRPQLYWHSQGFQQQGQWHNALVARALPLASGWQV